MYIKVNKNSQICGIWEYRTSGFTPEKYKPTLNMFQGRPYNKKIREIIQNYLSVSVAAQEGSTDAKKELKRIHYLINHNEK